MKRLVKKANKLFYHGTAFDNAIKILRSGSILHSSNTGNFSNLTINNESVFLTDQPSDAVQYSDVSSNPTDKSGLGVVFVIELSQEDLSKLQPGDDVLSPEQRFQVLKDAGLIEDMELSGVELYNTIEKYRQEITNYIQENYNWQQSLDIVSEVAFPEAIPASKIIRAEVYYNSTSSYETEVPSVEALNESAGSILES